MPNYANGAVYKIWSLSTDEIYIGSTVEPLSKRMTKHRNDYKRFQKGKGKYITSFKILEYGNAKIELIEQVNCKCRDELIAREGHYIRTLDCVNKVIIGRTKKEYDREYREANKDKITQRQKQWCQDNKDGLSQYKKQWYQENRDARNQTMKQYRINNKEKLAQYHKQYRQNNKERLAQKDKQKYQKNKAKLSEKIKCECGSVVTRGCLTRHKKTKKHLAFMNALN